MDDKDDILDDMDDILDDNEWHFEWQQMTLDDDRWQWMTWTTLDYQPTNKQTNSQR